MADSTSHYTVLARRFRPQTFDEVVGQEHVAQALKNAIRGGRVAHAYLFTGARGVGKTSMARILAKALNCPNVEDGKPCNQCEICRGISTGSDVDVLEIDGASNRGIDDIRNLRANVGVKSMRTRNKVYIIDEVHMLSREAFNALLKTLEEPPPNVKFVFCTTEPNKLPDTILSRCQRFDFKSIANDEISKRLEQIATAEGYTVEHEVIEMVARRAGGSMRDSQSLFDQLLASGEDHLSAADVHNLLGTAGDERLIAIVEACIHGQRDALLVQLGEALDSGVQLSELADQLVGYLRDLMVLSARAENVAMVSVAPDKRETLQKQAIAWGLQRTVASVEILSAAKSRMFRSSFARALLETALIRISLLDALEPLDELIESLRTGQSFTPKGPSAGSRPSKPANPGPTPAVQPSRGRADGAESTEAKKPQSDTSSSSSAKSDDTKNVAEEPEPTAAFVTVPLEEGREGDFWTQVVSQSSNRLKSQLQSVSGVAISGPNRLELTFPKSYSFNKQYCEQPGIVGQIEQLMARVAGRSVQVSFRIDPQQALPSSEEEPPETEESAEAGSLEAPKADEFVEQAQAIFEGTIVKVEGIASPLKES